MIVRLSVTPAETKLPQDAVVGGYATFGHLTSGSVSWITTLPVAASTVYVSVNEGRPVASELMKNPCAGSYTFTPSICSSERVGFAGDSARRRPALHENVIVVFAYVGS